MKKRSPINSNPLNPPHGGLALKGVIGTNPCESFSEAVLRGGGAVFMNYFRSVVPTWEGRLFRHGKIGQPDIRESDNPTLEGRIND